MERRKYNSVKMLQRADSAMKMELQYPTNKVALQNTNNFTSLITS